MTKPHRNSAHPSFYCYKDHGCRCDGCRAKNAERSSRWRRAQGPPTYRRWHPTSISEEYNCTVTMDEYNRLQTA